MHGHWFVSLRQQEHAFLGSALHFIQGSPTSLPTYAGCPSGFKLNNAAWTYQCSSFTDILRLFQ